MRSVSVWIAPNPITVQEVSIDRIYDHEREKKCNGEEFGGEGEEAKKLNQVNNCASLHSMRPTAYASRPAEARISLLVIL
jgi:hypothetical protein